MYNVKKITFRCRQAPHTLWTPEFQHDVIATRTHPDYEEGTIADDGSFVPTPPEDDGVGHRPPLNTAPIPTESRKAPKKKAA